MALNVLSLGAGVQSTCVLLMSCHGLLPKLDHVIFADTGWEPKAVYDHLDWLKQEVQKFSLNIITVSAGNLKQDIIDHYDGKKKWLANPPLFTLDISGKKPKLGQMRRKCTSHFKVRPIERYIKRNILKIKRFCALPTKAINLWMGISSDEVERLRDSLEHWKINYYPLVGIPVNFGFTFSRQNCLEWLNKTYPNIKPVKSACLGCPFHSAAQWQETKQNEKEWLETCEVDDKIRHLPMMKNPTFLHRDRIPLRDINFDIQIHKDDDPMNDECTGYCGN